MFRSGNSMSSHIVFLISLFMVLVLPSQLYANSGVFGITTDYHDYDMVLENSIEQYDIDEIYSWLNIDDKENYMLLEQYFLNYQPEIKNDVVKNFNINLFTLVSNSETDLDSTEKGVILQKYIILPEEFMELILYENENSSGVFGLNNPVKQDGSNSHNYTIEAQSELLDGLTVFYGYDTLKELYNKGAVFDGDFKFISQNVGLQFELLPGIKLDANYKKTLEDVGLSKEHKAFKLAYTPWNSTSINAIYSIISMNNLDIKMDSDILWIDPLNKETINPDLSNLIIKQLGLAVQPNNYSRVSADYITMKDENHHYTSSKTIVGVKLGDNKKEINAIYEMENIQNVTTTSAGLELGFVNLAELKAMYSKVQGNEMSEDLLKSFLDLGLNFSLDDYSVLKIQYQWVLPEELDFSDETKAEASLEVNF